MGKQQTMLIFLSVLLQFVILVSSASTKNPLLPNDASALLGFKTKADLNRNLNYSRKTSFEFCQWRGVHCSNSRAVKVIIENMNLSGVFAANTLTQLSELRVLSLQNDSLTGPVPDLSGLLNLKVLFLSKNYFSGSIPPSISTLHRLKTLDVSHNMLAGSIPVSLNGLDRLSHLRLDFNRFNGSLPAFNQSGLQIFNVSHNDLTGAIPVTPTLSRFDTSSFSQNPKLCGEIILKECRATVPFFGLPETSAPPPAAAALSQTAVHKHRREALVIVFTIGACLFILSLLCFVYTMLKCKKRNSDKSTRVGFDASVTGNVEAVMIIEQENNMLEAKVKRVQQEVKQMQIMGKSGNLIFCAGESQVYTLDQLMRASADLLGRGTMGSTYKAVLDSRLIVTVKRLDGGRLAGASHEVFEGHMGAVGRLRHTNLVPLRAFFQAKEERLLVYDYQANGSLFSLIHGSKSERAKPLHWTSCLKIAEDIAQGLSYIHQAWRLVHGNLKSSNILLGSDFEACLTDYCLVALAGPSTEEDKNTLFYKAPEIRKFNTCEETSKSDVYSFGVLLLELLTGKQPTSHPNVMPGEMVEWMRSIRDEDIEENKSEMLLEVAMACRVDPPEQRPTMWQVLKMIQEIKEVVLMEDNEFQPS